MLLPDHTHLAHDLALDGLRGQLGRQLAPEAAGDLAGAHVLEWGIRQEGTPFFVLFRWPENHKTKFIKCKPIKHKMG